MSPTLEKWKGKQEAERKHWGGHRVPEEDTPKPGRFHEWVRKTFRFKQGKVRLDIGSGLLNSFRIKDNSIIGIDPLVRLYRNKGNEGWYEPILGIGEHLPFKNNSFEDVYCIDGLDHYHNPSLVIDEIYRVLKVGGTLCLYVDINVSDRWHFPIRKEVVYKWLEGRFDTSKLYGSKIPKGSKYSLKGELIKI